VVHESTYTGQKKNMTQVMTACRGRFNEQPPREVSLLDREKSAFALGIVSPKGRPKNEVKHTGRCAQLLTPSLILTPPLTHPSPPETDGKPSSEPGVPQSAMESYIKKEFLGAYAKLRIATINFVVSVCTFAWKTRYPLHGFL